jgi:UDP-2-acetamido-3-amino-2,3-dideoxy-glucuronate N-acetyltransferase
MAGVPAKIVGWACECGVPLEFGHVRAPGTEEIDRASSAKCSECGRHYEKIDKGSIRRSDETERENNQSQSKRSMPTDE